MASRLILPFADVGNGISPSDGAKLFFFETGTSTDKNTFSDQTALIANANPVIADGDGLFPDIFLDGTYKVVLKDKNDVQQWEADPVAEIGIAPSITADDYADMRALDSSALTDGQIIFIVDEDETGNFEVKTGTVSQIIGIQEPFTDDANRFAERIQDGFQRSLLSSASITNGGGAETATASDYFAAVVELASGRAFNYDESGVADAYVLDVQTNQQGPQSYFTGLEVIFTAGNANTGSSTVNVAGLGVKNIANTSSGGEILTSATTKMIYNGTDFDIDAGVISATTTAEGIVELATDAEMVTGTDPARVPPVSAIKSHKGVAKAWVNFNGTGTVAIRDSFNVSSITDNGTGDYDINFTNNMANVDYTTFVSIGTDNERDGSIKAQLVTDVNINVYFSSNGILNDQAMISVVVFGDLA